MFPSFSFYNRLSNYIVYEVYICCLFSVISIYNHRTTKTNQKYPSVNL